MPRDTLTVLIFRNGDSLVSSLSGDRHFITDPQGNSTPCPLELACRHWLEYERSVEADDEAQERSGLGTQLQAPHSRPPDAASDYCPWAECSPELKKLWLSLGLTPEDIDAQVNK